MRFFNPWRRRYFPHPLVHRTRHVGPIWFAAYPRRGETLHLRPVRSKIRLNHWHCAYATPWASRRWRIIDVMKVGVTSVRCICGFGQWREHLKSRSTFGAAGSDVDKLRVAHEYFIIPKKLNVRRPQCWESLPCSAEGWGDLQSFQDHLSRGDATAEVIQHCALGRTASGNSRLAQRVLPAAPTDGVVVHKTAFGEPPYGTRDRLLHCFAVCFDQVRVAPELDRLTQRQHRGVVRQSEILSFQRAGRGSSW